MSQFSHEAYRIDIYIPKGTPPPGGYPALYVLDGDIVFATFADAVRNKSKAKEIEPAVVVGISGADGPKGGKPNLRLYLFRYVARTKSPFLSILGIIRDSADTISSLGRFKKR